MAGSLSVVPVRCLSDNYAYLLFDPNGDGSCAVVDASEAAPIQRALEERDLTLRAILSTHHHWDHVGGNLELSCASDVAVVAHASDRARIPGFSVGVTHGEEFEVLGRPVRALHVPGHTQGAVTYLLDGRAFTGDTLFCAGCGRLLEGTAEQLYDSLTRVLEEIPDDVAIYCGHEYTQANLEFACVMIGGEAIEQRLAETRRKRAVGDYCASATMGLERATNPFLLCHEPAVQRALGQDSALSTFREMRKRKDGFRARK